MFLCFIGTCNCIQSRAEINKYYLQHDMTPKNIVEQKCHFLGSKMSPHKRTRAKLIFDEFFLSSLFFLPLSVLHISIFLYVIRIIRLRSETPSERKGWSEKINSHKKARVFSRIIKIIKKKQNSTSKFLYTLIYNKSTDKTLEKAQRKRTWRNINLIEKI